MKKRIIVLLTCIILFAVPVSASGYILNPVNYAINVSGQALKSNHPLLNLDGTTYVPMRDLCEQAGLSVQFGNGKADVNPSVNNIEKFLEMQDSILRVKVTLPNETSWGTAFPVLDGNYAITNAHVVHDSKTAIVGNDRSDTCFDCDVVLCDTEKDIAVLKINGKQMPFPALELGDSDDVQIGDGVITLGHPFSEADCIPSCGTVIKYMDYSGMSCFDTNAVTFPGSSGGPLLDANGKVIGIMSAGSDLQTNVAIPINKIKPLLSTLK